MTSRRVRLLLNKRQSNVHLRNPLERYPTKKAQYNKFRISVNAGPPSQNGRELEGGLTPHPSPDSIGTPGVKREKGKNSVLLSGVRNAQKETRPPESSPAKPAFTQFFVLCSGTPVARKSDLSRPQCCQCGLSYCPDNAFCVSTGIVVQV